MTKRGGFVQRRVGIVPSLVAAFALVAGLLTGVPSSAAAAVPAAPTAPGGSPSEPMKGRGTKFTVSGPMTGPNGATRNILAVWGVDPSGTVRLVTAYEH